MIPSSRQLNNSYLIPSWSVHNRRKPKIGHICIMLTYLFSILPVDTSDYDFFQKGKKTSLKLGQ